MPKRAVFHLILFGSSDRLECRLINEAAGVTEGISVECEFVMEWKREERELIRDRHPL
jgi:hypothetical protein